MEQPRGGHKDWTWVLDRPCDECGFDATSVDRDQLGALFRTNAASWRAALGRGGLVTQRPPSAPGEGPTWSAGEYGAHVRDVYELFRNRLTEMLKKDDPRFADWDPVAAAVAARYHEQDPGPVSYALASTAGRVADMFDRVSGAGWARTGRRSDGYTFDVESLGLYLLHDVTHHLRDVERGYEALTDDVEG